MNLLQNFSHKIGYYRETLNFTEAEIDEMIELCESMIEVYRFVSNARAYHKQLTAWRDDFFLGIDDGQPLAAPSIMAHPPNLTLFAGAVKRFAKIRAVILTSPNYAESIGYDLGLYGAEKLPVRESDLQPKITFKINSGSKIEIKGSMQRMDAMRIEYAPENGIFKPAAFITRTPAAFELPPETPGTLEKGTLRAIYIKNNKPFGNFSPEQYVTLY